jgi:hypothetical protein
MTSPNRRRARLLRKVDEIIARLYEIRVPLLTNKRLSEPYDEEVLSEVERQIDYWELYEEAQNKNPVHERLHALEIKVLDLIKEAILTSDTSICSECNHLWSEHVEPDGCLHNAFADQAAPCFCMKTPENI